MLLDPFSRALFRGALYRLVEVDEFSFNAFASFFPTEDFPAPIYPTRISLFPMAVNLILNPFSEGQMSVYLQP